MVGGCAYAQCGQDQTVESEEAHRPGIHPARADLGLLNDLHGAHLGGTRHGAGREGGREDVVLVQTRPDPADHIRDHVDDVGVDLGSHQPVHFQGVRSAAPGYVVAAQVHKHQVLGLLLGIAGQLPDGRLAGLFFSGVADRSGDGPQGYVTSRGQPDEELGTCSDDMHALRGHEVVHIGRRVLQTQPLVDLEGRNAGIHLDLMPELELIDIAQGYVLLALGKPLIETIPIDRVMGLVWIVRPDATLYAGLDRISVWRLPRRCVELKQPQHIF